MGVYGLHVKKENDAYMEDLQYLTKKVANELASANKEKDSFAYDMAGIKITKEDIVIRPVWERNAAFYNAYYGTYYDLEKLDEILCAYAQNMTANPALYRFGTFVLGDTIVIDAESYDIGVWWSGVYTLDRSGQFVWDYLAYIEKNRTYQTWDELPPDKLQEIMNLFVTKEGDIMAKDLMCRQLLGLTTKECTYNTEGKAVSLSDAHINRPYLYVILADTKERGYYDNDRADLGVEQICREYESFCSDGILKEDGILDDFYHSYGYGAMVGNAADTAIYLRTDEGTEKSYAFVTDYVKAHGASVADMAQAETLSEQDYELLSDAWEAYQHQ